MKQKCRYLRVNQIDVETLIWEQLRNRRFEGLKFRRQHPIERYIVDFVCLECKLIIELDGGQHSEKIKYDDYRTSCLQGKGYRVIRFWNHDVMNNLEVVLREIYEEVQK